MKRKILGLTAIAAFALVHDSWAAGNTNSAAVFVGGIRGTISCHDLQLVPMTADAEQALPLQVVAHLSCGDQVALLSDSEGYTVKIRTSDGKNGYVARMYLTALPANSSSLKPAYEGATTDNGIARWSSGAPGSEQFYIDGSLIESLSANGITVQVSLHDTDWKLRASVAIANESGAPVYVNPRLFTLDELTPRLKSLAYQNPRWLAKSPNHQAFSTAASATAPTGSMQHSQASAYLVANYHVPSDHGSAPNYFAQAQAGQETKSAVFPECTIDPKQKVSGAVWFERDKNPQELTLRVFVGDLIFEFPLSFSQHN